ncbi:MAG: hypothetical protein D6781_14275, partial [Verrucomicrobia bacterium]
QFWEDMAFSSTNDMIRFTPGAEREVNQQETGAGSLLFWGDNTRIRGIRVENIVRNGFRTNIPSDAYNAARFEFQRGPNAILFGTTGDPAGLVNRTTQDAVFRNEGVFQNRLTEHGGIRNSINYNRVLVDDTFAVRLAAMRDDDKYWVEPNFQEQTRFYGAAQWRVNDKLTLKISGEYIDWLRAAPEMGIHFDGVTPFLEAAKAQGKTPAELAQPSAINTWPNYNNGLPRYFKNWGYSGGNTTQIVFDGNDATPELQNWHSKLMGAPAEVVGTQNVSLPIGFAPLDFNIFGNSQTQKFNGYNVNFVAQYRVNDKIQVEYAHNREMMNYDFIANWDSTRLNIDGASTLQDGVTPNPMAGKYFVTNATNWGLWQDRYITNHRLTASFSHDFAEKGPAWLGKHDVAVLLERFDRKHYWDGMRLVNTTPLEGYQPELWDPNWSHQNAIRFVNYVDLDTKTIYGVHNSRDFLDYAKTVPGITPEWIPTYQAIGGGQSFDERLDSTLIVWHAKFWEDRIVPTVGWRKDRIERYNGTVGQDPNRPAGVAQYARDVQMVKDEQQSALAPDTYSYGLVFHAIRDMGALDYLSLYYNHSNSFTSAVFFNLPDGSKAPNAEGENTDYGFKFGLMRNRVTGVFSIFEATNKGNADVRGIKMGNLSQLFEYIGKTEYTNIPQVFETQDIQSTGWEFQATANLARNWRATVTVDHFKTEKTNIAMTTGRLTEEYRDEWLRNPDDIIGTGTGSRTVQEVFDEFYFSYLQEKAQEGSRTMNERAYKVTLVTSYDFLEGMLRGFGVGLDYVWQDRALTGYALQNVGGAWVPDPDNPFFNGKIGYLGAHVRYNRKLLNDKLDWTIQLNVRNIGDVDPYVIRHGASADAPTQKVPTYISRGEPQTFILTNTFRF